MGEEKKLSREHAPENASPKEATTLPYPFFHALPTSRRWFPAAVLLTGLLLTLLACYYATRMIQLRAHSQFEKSAQRARSSIQTRMEVYDALLRGTAGFMQVEKEVTRQRFHSYIERLRIPENSPGVEGLGFVARVSAPDKDQLLTTMHEQGEDQFHVWPVTEKADYYPITFLEPQSPVNERAIGYDMSSEPARSEAMNRARDTGEATASGRVFLIQDSGQEKHPGFLIYFPVYQGGAAPGSIAERRSKLLGFAYSPFRAGDLFAAIFANEISGVEMEIYDGTNIDSANLLFRSGTPDSGVVPFRHTLEEFSWLDIDGRTWTTHFFARPEVAGEWIVLSLLAGGGMLSLAMFYLTRAEARARRGAERAAAQLKISEVALRESEERLRRYATELEHRVAERTANLAQSIESLEGVLYHVAHDLRAPLRGMASFTNILLEEYGESLDDRGRDYAARISNSAQRMDRLVQDLLAYGRLTHTEVPLSKLSLETEVKAAVDQFSEEIAACGASVEICAPLPPVKANASILNQIISNLLSNALKFVRDKESPHLRIFAEETTSRLEKPGANGNGTVYLDSRLSALDGKFVRLWFEDNGIGIAPQFHERIFRMFERLHGAGSYPGTGIGLAIVRKGIERMGGRVGVESSLGAGSRFWVELPAA